MNRVREQLTLILETIALCHGSRPGTYTINGYKLTGMDQLTKDRFEATAKVVAILGGIISAIALVVTLRSSTEQRASELRWKQANLAMELVDTMLSDPQAFNAFRMIDWYGRTYQISIDKEAVIGIEEVRYSLDVQNNFNLSPSDVFVRESFDRLFYHMGRMERSVRTELIKFDDVRSPLGYYAKILCNEYKAVLTPYMTQLRVDDAQQLLNRFQISECESRGEGAPMIEALPVRNKGLIDVIVEETGIDQETVQYAMEALLENIKQQVANGEEVNLSGFGIFLTRVRDPRTGRNPQTGETIQIESGIVPRFQPAKALKAALKTGVEGKDNFPSNENLSETISEETGIDREAVQHITEVFLMNIRRRLASGEEVVLPEFGVFSVTARVARSGRNPGRGGRIEIPSRKSIRFKPDNVFKNAVNARVVDNTRVIALEQKIENKIDHIEQGQNVTSNASFSVDCEMGADDRIAERAKAIIVDQLGVNEDLVINSKLFVEDLGADSLDHVELVMAMEEEFNIDIPDADEGKIFTVKDLVSYLNKRLCEP